VHSRDPWLERSALMEQILPAGGGPPSLVTVVAPSGHGKTMLLKGLARRGEAGQGPRAVYLPVGEAEEHPGLFVDLLARAVVEALPAADPLPLLQLKRSLPVEELASRLPFVLDRVVERAHERDVLIMLDDVHEARAGGGLQGVLVALLRAELARLSFAIASRRALPWLVRHVRDEVRRLDLTSRELAFSVVEVQRFLAERLRAPIPLSTAERVHANSGGWPAALALLALVARDVPPDELTGFLADVRAEDLQSLKTMVRAIMEERGAQAQLVMKVAAVLPAVDRDAVVYLFDPAGDPKPRERSHIVALGRGDVEAALEELETAQVLTLSEGHLAFNPMLRQALLDMVSRESRSLYRAAHRRAAAWLLAASPEPSTDALDSLLEAGEFDTLLSTLEQHAERLFLAGYHGHLARWLLRLEERYAKLPYWANYYLGRVYVVRGEWEQARSYLDHCMRNLDDAGEEGEAWRWHPRVCLGYAEMYQQRGMGTDAATYCRRGLGFLRQAARRQRFGPEETREAQLLEVRMLLLQGALRLEAGSYGKVREIFEEARALSERAGLSAYAARSLDHLGTIAARLGDMSEARARYEEALSLASRERDPDLYAEIAAHLAVNHRMTGRVDTALALLRDVREIREVFGQPATVAEVLTELATLRAMMGDGASAEDLFRRAVRLLDVIGSVAVRVKVLNHYAVFLATEGRLYEAQTMRERAEGLVSVLRRPDPALLAGHAATAMELAVARGQLEEGLSHLGQAVARQERLGARYDIARLYWRAADIHHRLFVSGQRETPESVISYLELAATDANHYGYVFEPVPGEDELLVVAYTAGLPEARRYAAARLGLPEEGEAGVAPRLPDPTGARYLRFQQRAQRRDAFLVTSPEGVEGFSEEAVERLVQDRGASSLILLLDEQEMVNFGVRKSLAQKRVILPLLVHFLRHGRESFSMLELAQSVWGAEDLNDSMKTKVKVAISRLRSLLGKGRSFIVTARRPERDGRSVVTYGLAPDLLYFLVEAAAPEEDDLG